MGVGDCGPDLEDKRTLRRTLLARRATRSAANPARYDAGAPAGHVLPLIAGHGLVASYLCMEGEASTEELHATCWSVGVRLGLPRLRADGDLDLLAADAASSGRPGLRGTREPVGALLEWADADLVIVPAVAVDRLGNRLGRGGGSYDRALSRVRPDVPVIALLPDDESLLERLPVEPHDRPVSAVATPRGVTWFAGDGIISSQRR